MRGKTRVSLPGDSSKKLPSGGQEDDQGRKVREGVASREVFARSMDAAVKKKAEKRLSEAQVCLDRYMNEWRMFQGGDGTSSVSRFITARRTQLLKEISTMRRRVNSEVSLLYYHERVTGGTGQLKIGKCGYPDLNNPSSTVMALQRVGIPVLMEDMAVLAERTLSDELLDEDMRAILMTFKDLGLEGRRYKFSMNSNRDEVSISLSGYSVPGSYGSLKDLIGPVLSELEGHQIIIERPWGSCDRFNATGLENGGLVQLDPLEAGIIRESTALSLMELAEEWSAGRTGLMVRVPSGPLAHRRTALQVVMTAILKGEPVIIELEGPDGKEAREYLVDELDMASRKVVLIDPFIPRGVEKTVTFYGGDVDKVLERWGERSYIITTFWRNSTVAEGT
ncbi:MAG: hypothetical protein MUC62_10810 [Candidatus Thermoplasmatota archaeon]|jgi:hypothetical protein|nr:hypothetical protein [Candidatus Thermoplasmatota archaeon]